MLRHTIDSFVNNDPELAISIMRSDIRVDQLEGRIARKVVEMMKQEPQFIEAGVELIKMLRHLERMADHATNVAEEIIFFTEAKIVRNRFDQEAFDELQKELQIDTEGEDEE
jgi:phosphate transport system protein